MQLEVGGGETILKYNCFSEMRGYHRPVRLSSDRKDNSADKRGQMRILGLGLMTPHDPEMTQSENLLDSPRSPESSVVDENIVTSSNLSNKVGKKNFEQKLN